MKWFSALLCAGVAALAWAGEKAYEVEVVRDVPYVAGDEAERHKLDLYAPKGKKDAPVLLFFHGGGFTKGERKSGASIGRLLVARGYVVASAGYRLAPETKHPGAVQDGAKALAWARKNISKYGGDPEQLFVGGHSAGAILSGILATDERFLKAEGLGLKDVRGVVSLSGLFRLPEARAPVFGDAEARDKASAINHVREGLPPFLLVRAENDNPDRDGDSEAFADALKKHRVPYTFFVAKGRNHGTVYSAMKDGDPTLEEVVKFLQRHGKPAR
jgi:acetyl esterase/lipase